MVRVICKAAKGDGRAVGRGLREAGRPGPAPSLTRGHNILPTAPGDSIRQQEAQQAETDWGANAG